MAQIGHPAKKVVVVLRSPFEVPRRGEKNGKKLVYLTEM
jgi:hypothetical protein